MTAKLLFSSPLLVCTAASALLAVSQGGWTADHRDAPLISFLDTGQTVQCEDVLGLPMRVSVNVPAEVLKRENIYVDLYTRSDTGLVDAADYIVWRQSRGPTLAVIVNPGDKPGYSQVNEGFITLPSMEKQAYAVRFRFESITDGKSCDLSTRVDYGLPNAVVINWSSGAVRHAQ
jgi:hypothetical protein